MAKISVIVPIYNTSKFLRACLDSLVNQTFKDIEIICINDGSTDNSLEILEQYRNKDERIKVISQENGGISAARNKGIELASGDYISFIDSDDYVDNNFYEKLYDAIERNGADIAAATILRKKQTYEKVRVKYDEEKIYETLADKIKICAIPKCCYIWNKLYKTSLVKENPFKNGVFYEDILWSPEIIKKSKKLVTVADTNYYYVAHSSSTVKKPQDKKHQMDSYNAKKFIVNFFDENNLELNKKERIITKKIVYIGNFAYFKVKEYKDMLYYKLFGFIPLFRKKIKEPIVKNNTFIVWEPCSKSHSEVVPGYAKYLLDLGYDVSILVHPDRYKEGLFCRFKEKNISYNKLNKKDIKKFFKNNDLENVKGVMVTTVGKICDCVHYEQAYETFNPNTDRKKLLFVEHEASFAADKGSWDDSLITLRELNYKGAKSVVVNPHYFGEVKITPKNNDIVNFITIGAIRPNKKNSQMIIDSIYEVYKRGYRNFKLTVVGKGSPKHIPAEIRKYVDIKGRLSFSKMYDEIEKADFFLMSYNEDDIEHIRYNTSGTSGNFQLIYGFLKPCILTRGFAPINGLDDSNAILYQGDNHYPDALERAINMTGDEYSAMQNNLKKYEQELYQKSLENLRKKING